MDGGAGLQPDPKLAERFRLGLDRVVPHDSRIGIAVSGGADSLALLLLAAAVRPGLEAATVDHGLRDGAGGEADMVAEVCARLGVPHRRLTVQWAEKPGSAIQERARAERYRLLGGWAEEGRLTAIATAHHADDQAETLLMRLARGAGVRGLAGMRPLANVPGTGVLLVRPLLDWRRSELEQVCADAGLTPAQDPSNVDEQFERVRMRRALAAMDVLDAGAIARSASHLAEADAAADWAARIDWSRTVTGNEDQLLYQPSDAPAEVMRRVVAQAVRQLGSEGDAAELRGGELDRLLATLAGGGSATLRGVLCSGGPQWRFTRAPARRD